MLFKKTKCYHYLVKSPGEKKFRRVKKHVYNVLLNANNEAKKEIYSMDNRVMAARNINNMAYFINQLSEDKRFKLYLAYRDKNKKAVSIIKDIAKQFDVNFKTVLNYL